MKLYINTSTDPYFNLASEEYLLKNAKDDIIMLWRNEPSVIIGKNQNAYAEINFDFVGENKIKVVRRLTGGGAVFHDLGNLNYTFISPAGGRLSNGIREGGLDFAHFTKPIISALADLLLNAALSGRNDIVVKTEDGERKISGNAQCVVDGTTLHHGTLLFSAELGKLSGALNVDAGKLKSKGITSVRSRVANIRDLISGDVLKTVDTVDDFCNFVCAHLTEEFGISSECFSDNMITGIEQLAAAKYRTDEWNLRRFGNFSSFCHRRFDYGVVEVSFSVTAGYIEAVEFGGDFFGELDVSELSKLLTGTDYSRGSLVKKLREIQISRYISGAAASEIANLLLSANSVL